MKPASVKSRSGTLVIRPEKIGDIVAAMPAMCSLRASFPGEPLWLLTDTVSADLVGTWPVLDHVVAIPWRGRNRGERATWKEIRSEFCDAPKFRRCVILYDGCPGLNFFARSLGIPQVAQLGFTWPAPLLGHRCFLRRTCRGSVRYSDFFMGVAHLAGAGIGAETQPLAVPPGELAAFCQRFPGYANAPRRVVVHPFHNASGANLGLDDYRKLCASLVDKFGGNVFLVGTDAEAKRIGGLPPGVRGDLLGRLSLRELMAALSLAEITIGGSSGVLHIAGALRCPTLGLFCPHHDPLWRPSGPQSVVLSPPRSRCKYVQSCDSGCGWPHGCNLGFGIAIPDVVLAAAHMLGERK